MPVIAKLSKRLYDQLGEDIANELVELLNQVDASSRNELRELNELNFARFDAKLEQRVAETNARMDRGFAELHARIDKVVAELNARIDKLGAELNARIDVLSANVVTKADLENRLTAHTRFLYLGMALQFAATVGLWLR